MNCQFVENTILFYLDNELRDKDRKAFEQHIEQCPECRNLVNEIGKTYEHANHYPAVQIDESFTNKVFEKIENKTPVIQLPVLVKKWLVAAGVAIAIVSTGLSAFSIVYQKEDYAIKSLDTADFLPVNEWYAEPVEAMLLNE
jgi:anti-sigma factor RsiW